MDNFRGFQEYRPNASRYNNRIREDDWNRFKPKLEDLHNQRLTRQQILDIITKDFEAAGVTVPTYGQLCTKFDKWGYSVYKKGPKQKNTNNEPVASSQAPVGQHEYGISQAFSPESSNGSTVVPDVGQLNLGSDDHYSTPRTFTDFSSTPRSQYLEPSPNLSDNTPKGRHSRSTSDVDGVGLGTISESDAAYTYNHAPFNSDHYAQYPSLGSKSLSTASAVSVSHEYRSSISDGQSSRTSLYQTTSELNNVEPDDPQQIAARTQKANDALDAVYSYLKSLGKSQAHEDMLVMVSLAGYLFATRSYSSAFRIYHKIYDIMCQDMQCDDIARLGALMRCYQSAVEPYDLDFMQKELHQVLTWNFSEPSLQTLTIQMLQNVEIQISEGFNLTQGSVLSTTSITRNLDQLMNKGTTSTYPSTKHLYWRLRLLKHSPFHSGCTRLLRLMSELLSWAWAAMAVLKFPDPAITNHGCLCKDGMYFDFVRMVTTVILEAAMGYGISQHIKLVALKQTSCDCVMCGDLETTFELCPVETFTAIALLTVDRCRLDWTSCHPGGRHQELSPRTILQQQLLPTIDSLLDQVAADIRSQTTIHTSDLYDDFLSCVWSCFETHDLPLKNARFDASEKKVEDLMTTLITDELNKSHPARNSTLEDPLAGKTPIFTYGEPNDEIANKITAKRTRSNVSALTKSSSNASERSMIRIRKKLKYRGSGDYLHSMSSYSSLSSRNSMNRFSYVTGLPELETVMDADEMSALPPDLTPDEFRSMQRHDSWTRRSDHFSWVPSRPGSVVTRTSWKDSSGQNAFRRGSEYPAGGSTASATRAGSVTMNHRTSQKELGPREQAMQNSIMQAEQARQSKTHYSIQNQGSYQQNYQAPQQQQRPISQQLYHPGSRVKTPPPPESYDFENVPPPEPQYQPQLMPPPPLAPYQSQQIPPTQSANSSSTSLHGDGVTPTKPQRRDSNKTTRSRESQKGRYTSELKRIDGVLSALQ